MEYLIENKMIAEYLRELKLPSVREFLEIKEQQANAEHWTYRHFLYELMRDPVRFLRNNGQSLGSVLS